jgi:thiaminase
MSLLESLEITGGSKLKLILDHPVISTLRGTENGGVSTLSSDELVEVRNNFYIQDYFYLICGYETARNIIVCKSLNHPNLKKDNYRDPFFLITDLLEKLDQLRISPRDCIPSETTSNYISFIIECACRGYCEGIVAQLACNWIFYKIGEEFAVNSSNKECNDWFRMYTAFDNSTYVRSKINKLEKALNLNMCNDFDSIKEIFNQCCDFEYKFINSLYKIS